MESSNRQFDTLVSLHEAFCREYGCAPIEHNKRECIAAHTYYLESDEAVKYAHGSWNTYMNFICRMYGATEKQIKKHLICVEQSETYKARKL
jgi:hypothetical protein